VNPGEWLCACKDELEEGEDRVEGVLANVAPDIFGAGESVINDAPEDNWRDVVSR
jgi:hypothetical protein